MPLFTLVLEYQGGTYIRQARGRDVRAAVKKGLAQFEILTPNARQRFAEDIEDEGLTSVNAVENVWCASRLAWGHLALMHIVATAE